MNTELQTLTTPTVSLQPGQQPHNGEPPVEEQMLRALELLHYGNRFRDELFVVALPPGAQLRDFILDLRLLHAAEIWCLVVAELPTAESLLNVQEQIAQLGRRGLACSFFPGVQGWENRDFVQEQLALGQIPVIGLGPHRTTSSMAFPEEFLWKNTLSWAQKLQAKKVFLLSEFRGIEVSGKFIYQLTPTELEKILHSGESTNLGLERLGFLHQESLRMEINFSIASAKSGRLFLETFTHWGAGTLLTRHHPDEIRRGRLGDVTEISLLMRPSISAGLLLPTSDDEVAATIESFFLYTVNNALVACARLIDYSEAAELGKFCTLPRYQGKGRARDLALKMIEEAKRQEKKYVFALSIVPKMWDFFLSLGFSEVARETFPKSWQEKYDFSRPSKGFRLEL